MGHKQLSRSPGLTEVDTNLHLLGKQERSTQFGIHVVVPAGRLALAGAVTSLWLCQQLKHSFSILGFQMAPKELQAGARVIMS